MGVSDGVWECGKPFRFSIISMPHSEGEKGEVRGGGDFLFMAREGPLLGAPFSPCGFAECMKKCMKRGVRNGGSARGFGTAERALSGKE